jgi:hypothetical protein
MRATVSELGAAARTERTADWPPPQSSGNGARMTAEINALLKDKVRRDSLVRDLVQVVEAEVAEKKGLSGMATKAAFAMVTGVRPGFLRDAIHHLLDGSVAGLKPLLDRGQAEGHGVGAALRANPAQTASALLEVVDEKAKRAKNPALRKAYERLRGSAEKQVAEAVPRLADTLDRHLA